MLDSIKSRLRQHAPIFKAHPRLTAVGCGAIALSLMLFVVGTDDKANDDTTATVQIESIALPEPLPVMAANDPVDHSIETANNPHPQAEGSLAQAADEPAQGSIRSDEVTIRSGDTMARVFSRKGLSANTLHRIMSLGEPVQRLARLRVGETVLIERNEDGELVALEFEAAESHNLRVVHSGDGFVLESVDHKLEARPTHAHAVIRGSLYGAAQQAGLSDRLIMELAGIFGWDIDFVLDIRAGDRFTLIYERIYRNGEYLRDGDILAARFINRQRELDAVRFVTSGGSAEYFSPDGRNMRKAFIRTPVDFRRISSQFNPNRLHPVLGTRRPHRGVDYAAPTGTPIHATGDGRVRMAGTHGGYGKTVIIEHAGRYETLYAHMSRIANSVRNGTRVRQGQVIGYVGMTGLATGPHLHYEFRVDGVHKNPLTVELPDAPPLEGSEMESFRNATRAVLGQLDVLHAGREIQWRLAQNASQTSGSGSSAAGSAQ